MGKFRSVLLVISFCVLPLFVQASSLKDDSLDELLILSGIESQANDMLSSIKGIVSSMGGADQAAKASSSSSDVLEQLIKPDVLIDTIRKQLQSSLSEEEARTLIDWYSSNLGNRIARAEKAAAQPDVMLQIQKYAAKLTSDIDRMSLSKELVYASGFYDKSFDTQAIMSLIAEVFAQKDKRAGESVDVDAIKAGIANQQNMMKAQLENFLLITVAYTYRDFSEDEIDQYLKVLLSPEMKKFNSLGIEASYDSLENMVRTFAKQ